MAEPPPAKITHVTALLVVPRGQVISAARYYQDVFGAAFIDKYDDVVDIVHQATIKIGATTFYITDQYSRDLPAPNLCIRLKCQDPKSLNARISRDGFSYGQRPTALDFLDFDGLGGLGVQNVKDKFGHSWQLASNHRGIFFQTHDLTHEVVREIFIAALELREKRTVGQSIERVSAIEFVKGLRTRQNQIGEEEEPKSELDPEKEEPKRKRRRLNQG